MNLDIWAKKSLGIDNPAIIFAFIGLLALLIVLFKKNQAFEDLKEELDKFEKYDMGQDN